MRATVGAVNGRSPSAAVVTVVIATARGAAVKRLGVSSAGPPKPAIRRRLMGVRTMLAISASTVRVAGQQVP
jgi:hypothetical protein